MSAGNSRRDLRLKLEGCSTFDDSEDEGVQEQPPIPSDALSSLDTRTHVVVELYDTERSYVESLQVLVTKYLEPLKNPENAGLLDTALVDEIFLQVPALLSHHQVFLEDLKKRLEHWDLKQKLGDVFLEMFSKPDVIETYTSYVNNWKRAREIIKNAQQSKPAFSRFLEAMAREHKGKLALDSLLIKPIQKFPKYELLLQRLLKHTDPSHPDHALLISAQREIHEQLLKINCTEREAVELEQLREIEGLIDGLMELVSNDRQYLRHDLVNMAAGGGTRKERALFLFSDLLLVTSIKRRSGTIKRPLTVPLQELEIVRAKDENLRQMLVEIENLTEDISLLNQINDISWSLHCSHSQLDEVLKEMLTNLNKQLVEQQNSDSQLSCLDLTLNTSNGLQNISVMFLKPDKRASWEETFNDAKHKLAISGDRRPSPELVTAVPIRKTRAGLQFTCAAPTIGENGKDVWVCNSDGYVGQVCILSLEPEPTVTSCNGVCNAKILCITSVPGINNSIINDKGIHSSEIKDDQNTIQFDSSSSSEDDKSDSDEQEDNKYAVGASVDPVATETLEEPSDVQQSTMWLGTEDGCIHIYNSSDNIRIKKNKYKLQHGSAILSIIYLDNRVFVALANGDVIIYERDQSGGWNTTTPLTVAVGSATMPASKMIPNAGKLWCACGNTIKVINIQTFAVENVFTVNNDLNKPITCIVILGNGVWLSLQNSSLVKCYHAVSFEFLCELNLAPAVTKMLTSCDDIIRQHKAACLRVTSLLACKDLLWIGTSAGVILTVALPHIAPSTVKLSSMPSIIGVPHGHTGHVRFLTNVEWHISTLDVARHSYKSKPEQRTITRHLIISGGDGYEDFRNANLSEVAGREDSTNHLLLWNI
ncbi:RhoGEF domain [Popillia japonica]|uniref:RhoGEF domain n=1 Tax=Popillia japonica TaxID=7064 RepID=A0AAW1KIY8_POPJA